LRHTASVRKVDFTDTVPRVIHHQRGNDIAPQPFQVPDRRIKVDQRGTASGQPVWPVTPCPHVKVTAGLVDEFADET
jgi:hypothetical protein